MWNQLSWLTKSIPLLKLRQGGTLSIRSSLPVTNIKIFPEWRDDGLIHFKQCLMPGDKEADVKVMQEDDKVTSMGRLESHFSVEVSAQQKNSFLHDDFHPSEENSSHLPCSRENFAVDTSNLSDHLDSKEHGRVESHVGLTHCNRDEATQESTLELIAWVPEKLNLLCELSAGGSITIDSKMEGDIHLFTKEGDVFINKLRGHSISILTQGNSVVYASDVLEAQNIKIYSLGRFQAKRIHGTNIDVHIEKKGQSNKSTLDVDSEGACIDVSSLFVSGLGGANLRVSSAEALDCRAIRVKSSHGHVNTQVLVPQLKLVEHAVVELGGVNGSCDVFINVQSIVDDTTASLAQIHVDSLFPESVSFVTTTSGNIQLTFDRKVECDLRLLSSNNLDTVDTRVLLEDDDKVSYAVALKELDGLVSERGEEPRISVKTDAFTPVSTAFTNIEYVEGSLNNKSMEPDSRFDIKTKGNMGIGKIRLEGAASQALKGFHSDGNADIEAPLFAVATCGRISIETLSWLGAISRRYGVEENGHEIGRTAAQRGRSFVPTVKK